MKKKVIRYSLPRITLVSFTILITIPLLSTAFNLPSNSPTTAHKYTYITSFHFLNAKRRTSLHLFPSQKDDIKVTNNPQPKNEPPTTNPLSSTTTTLPPLIPPHILPPLSILLISQFLLFIGVGAVIPTIPLYGKEIGLSSTANGIVISAPALALLLLSRVSGSLSDRARKPAMLYGMALIALSDFGTAVAQSLPVLLVARLGLGAGRGLSEAGERGMLADYANVIPAARGKLLAGQQACVALGIAVGAPLGGLVVERYGVRASFLCVTGAAVVALILYAFLPETVGGRMMMGGDGESEDGRRRDEVEKGGKSLKEEEQSLQDEKGTWRQLLTISSWRGLALCQIGATFGFAAKIASIPILATQILPGGAVGAGALLSVAGLTGLVGAPFGGYLTDRIGAKNSAVISGTISAAGLMFIPWALSAPSDVTIPLLDNVNFGGNAVDGHALSFSALVLTWSLGATAQGPALTAYAQELAPKGVEATSMALPRAAGDATYIIAPILLGTVMDRVGVMGVECAVAGVATLLGVGALFLLGDEIDREGDF